MSPRPPAEPGMSFDEIDTPALLIDLDAFEANLATLAAAAKESGVRLRPHAKTHKSPIIARKQMALGAVGQCCQKVSEAEILVEAGIEDVLVTNEVWGRRKLDRLAGLARHAKVGVCVDHAQNLADISAAAMRAGTEIGLLVEIDVGAGRCGVTSPEEALALAQAVETAGGVRFRGLQAYHGSAQHKRSQQEREAAIGGSAEITKATVEILSNAGIDCEIVGGAGTGTFEIEAASGIWNELQAGSYIFMDADYAKNRAADGRPISQFQHALFVMVTAMSQPAPNKLVVDAGHKALGNDAGFPDVWGIDGASYSRPSDEHGAIELGPSEHAATVGDRLLLVPGHCDPTVNLHDWYVGVRAMHSDNARVETVWPVAGRGAVF
ncbi:MAG: DSD1 family PLP-dependent enzyme [Pseudomonadota bacterium]